MSIAQIRAFAQSNKEQIIRKSLLIGGSIIGVALTYGLLSKPEDDTIEIISEDDEIRIVDTSEDQDDTEETD